MDARLRVGSKSMPERILWELVVHHMPCTIGIQYRMEANLGTAFRDNVDSDEQ